MKFKVSVILLLAVLVLPAPCMARYLIEMKSGSIFVTNMYWEEGDQIRYYHRGGIVGVSKTSVLTIKDTDAPVPREIPVEIVAEKIQEHEGDQEFKEKVEQYKSNLQQIIFGFHIASDNLRKAREREDQTAIEETQNQLEQLRNAQAALLEETLELYNGSLPEWWGELLAQ